ncbi:MAG: hypothetical protein AB2A00_39975 [Myxococcota bacterium]
MVLPALLPCLLLGAVAAADAPVTVAVLDLKARGVDPAVASSLLDVVAEEVGKIPRHKVLSRKEIEAMLDQEARNQLTGCDTSSCLAELAGALDATLLISGELARLGESTLVTLQLINQRFATVMNRVSINWPGAPDRLNEVVQAASQLLVLERTERKPGSVEVLNTPDGAEVFLDDKPLKGGKAEGLEVGLHLVRVEAGGHVGRVIPIIVHTGRNVRVNGELDGIPLYRRPVFWAGGVVGAVVLGGALVTAALLAGPIPVSGMVLLTGSTTVSAYGSVPRTR